MKHLSCVTVFITLHLLVFGTNQATGEEALYNGYQLVDVIPETESQFHALKSVGNHPQIDERHIKNLQGVQLWHESQTVNRPTALLVPSDFSEAFFSYLRDHNLKYEVKHSDFGRYLTNEKQKEEESRKLSLKSGTFNLNMYHSYDEIMGYLNDTAKKHENFVQFGSLGKSFEGREVPFVKIGFPAKAPKKILLLDAGFHANEWNGHASALHFIDRLVSDSALADLLHDIDIYVIPVMNPDGYEYSRTNKGHGWRLTRSGPHGDQKCYGADLNRNWDFHWCTDEFEVLERLAALCICMALESAPGPLLTCQTRLMCDTGLYGAAHAQVPPITPQYCGEKIFSEPEARALQQFMFKNKDLMKGYITLHSYSELIIHPYGCCEDNVTAQYSEDVEYLVSAPPVRFLTAQSFVKRVANKAADAIVEVGGPRYDVGTARETIIYTASGASDDYTKAMGVKFVYTIEIGKEYAVPQEQIESTARQIVAALIVFAREVQAYTG
ncbi:zinc carboxypeptidase domain-containing protein [Ditylenchus destructor]|uniref:Zinc carboxypeptidase domain-containing protein n=1 Tax=Ditylenchus destructor TaxID=166010 RepID=A0AAD4MNF7_9BILA|nr:zinc carboxypeptidase domain-containing protein [Ditylenchus destructor]